jgi:hypothetical protein
MPGRSVFVRDRGVNSLQGISLSPAWRNFEWQVKNAGDFFVDVERFALLPHSK